MKKRRAQATSKSLAITESSTLEEKQEAARELIDIGRRSREILTVLEKISSSSMQPTNGPRESTGKDCTDDFEKEMRRLREEMRRWEEDPASSGGRK